MIRGPLDEIRVSQEMYFDDELPWKIREWIEKYCVQSEGVWANQPLKITPLQWERILLPLYGWKQKDGTLAMNRALIFAPKKIIGKTHFCSALAGWHLCQQYEGGVSAAMISSSVLQAQHLFNALSDYIELSPLGEEWKVHRHNSTIDCEAKRSTLKVLSSRSEISGGSYQYWCWDEISEFPQSMVRVVWDRLEKSSMARKNAMSCVISTANYCCSKDHLAHQLYQKAMRLQSHAAAKDKYPDLHTLGVVFSVPLDCNWRDPENWWKHLPIEQVEGHPANREYFLNQYRKAEGNPEDELSFRVLLLNQFVQSSVNSAFPVAMWDSCKRDFIEDALYGYPCCVAADFSRRFDLTCYVIAVLKDGIIHLVPRSFLPANGVRRKKDGLPYELWATQDYGLTLTEGDVIDVRAVREQLLLDKKLFGYSTLYYDPNYHAEETRQALADDGLETLEFPQTYTAYDPCISFFERGLNSKTIAHNGNPLLTSCVTAAQFKRDHKGQRMLDKTSKSPIDLAVASVMAMQHYLVRDEPREWEGSYFTAI